MNFMKAKNAITATQQLRDIAHVDTIKDAVRKLSTVRKSLKHVTAEKTPAPTLHPKSDLLKRSVTCDFCAKLTLLEDAQQSVSVAKVRKIGATTARTWRTPSASSRTT